MCVLEKRRRQRGGNAQKNNERRFSEREGIISMKEKEGKEVQMKSQKGTRERQEKKKWILIMYTL